MVHKSLSVECSTTNGTSTSYTFLPTLMDAHKEGKRKVIITSLGGVIETVSSGLDRTTNSRQSASQHGGCHELAIDSYVTFF